MNFLLMMLIGAIIVGVVAVPTFISMRRQQQARLDLWISFASQTGTLQCAAGQLSLYGTYRGRDALVAAARGPNSSPFGPAGHRRC